MDAILDPLRRFLEDGAMSSGAKDGAELSAFERALKERFDGARREVMAEFLAASDVQADAIEIDGKVYRHMLRSSRTYMTTAGEVQVERSLYKDRTDPEAQAIATVEAKLGIVQNHGRAGETFVSGWADALPLASATPSAPIATLRFILRPLVDGKRVHEEAAGLTLCPLRERLRWPRPPPVGRLSAGPSRAFYSTLLIKTGSARRALLSLGITIALSSAARIPASMAAQSGAHVRDSRPLGGTALHLRERVLNIPIPRGTSHVGRPARQCGRRRTKSLRNPRVTINVLPLRKC